MNHAYRNRIEGGCATKGRDKFDKANELGFTTLYIETGMRSRFLIESTLLGIYVAF